LHRFATAIQAALTVAPDPGPDAVDWVKLRQVLDDLQPLLARGNMEANRIIETHRRLLHAALGPIGHQLEKQTERFLYPEAMATLKLALAEASTHET
jgi:hypothetical protein